MLVSLKTLLHTHKRGIGKVKPDIAIKSPDIIRPTINPTIEGGTKNANATRATPAAPSNTKAEHAPITAARGPRTGKLPSSIAFFRSMSFSRSANVSTKSLALICVEFSGL